MVALVAAQQLSIPMAEMEGRLEALMVMLPDLGGLRAGGEGGAVIMADQTNT